VQQICKLLGDVVEVGLGKLTQEQLSKLAPCAAGRKRLADAEDCRTIVPAVWREKGGGGGQTCGSLKDARRCGAPVARYSGWLDAPSRSR
jgi:hypothetical protein